MKILSMSGFVPEVICDVVRFRGYSGDRNISNFCGYVNDFISQAINDNEIDGIVFPKSCDSSRTIISYLDNCRKFRYQINVPATNNEFAVDFLAEEIADFKRSVEGYYNIKINDIPDRIKRLNNRNDIIAKYYNLAEKYAYGDYLRAVHGVMASPLSLITELGVIRPKNEYKKRVYIIGSFLSNENIADIIEESGLGIVGDNLPESGRIAGRHIDENDDVYQATARYILSNRLSPTQNDFSALINTDFREIERLHADAVIFVLQKFCEPYEYLYSVYKKKLDAAGIASLKIQLSDSEDERKARLYIEAFAGTL